MDLHAESPGALRNSLTNSSHTQNSESLSCHLPAQKCGRARNRPFTASNQILCLECSATSAKQQQYRYIRRCVGYFGGGVSNCDISFCRGMHVDLVYANGMR
jgi:hypothetical protein